MIILIRQYINRPDLTGTGTEAVKERDHHRRVKKKKLWREHRAQNGTEGST